MGRTLKSWQTSPNAPSTYEVAPHRYTIEGTDSSYRWANSYDAFMAGVPYKEGEVIYLLRNGVAAKAFILSVWYERDSLGDRREKYKVVVERVTGDAFSKNWEWVHPGFVQRGYAAAGLAPDVVAWEARETEAA